MWEIFRGDDAILELTIVDSAGAAVDITNYDIRFSVKKPPDDAVVLTKSTADATEIEKTTPAGGLAKIYLTGTDTAAMLGAYEYDIQLTDGNGVVTTYEKDVLIVKKDISVP